MWKCDKINNNNDLFNRVMTTILWVELEIYYNKTVMYSR